MFIIYDLMFMNYSLHTILCTNLQFFYVVIFYFLKKKEIISTPRRELAPPIEEDEEMDSEGHRGAPLRQIENNISALLRGEIAVVRVVDAGLNRPGRPIGFRPGVHKSESAKEMLLSGNFIQQSGFPPLPASPASSSPEMVNNKYLFVFSIC